jgi:hypothetical protein
MKEKRPQKCQISLRVSRAAMDAAYDYVQATGERITDLIERGIWLAIAPPVPIPGAGARRQASRKSIREQIEVK